MQLKNTIEKRRSIRRYLDKEVSKELVEDLINCARLAPSAKNRQPLKFIVVSEKTKDKIADIMIENELSVNEDLEQKIYKSVNTVLPTAKVIKQAPILILCFKPREVNWTTGDLLSLGASIEHILLRATDLGLGSLWIRDIVYTIDKISELVGETEMELCSAISIGYPDEKPTQRPRKPLSEVLEWYNN